MLGQVWGEPVTVATQSAPSHFQSTPPMLTVLGALSGAASLAWPQTAGPASAVVDRAAAERAAMTMRMFMLTSGGNEKRKRSVTYCPEVHDRSLWVKRARLAFFGRNCEER